MALSLFLSFTAVFGFLASFYELHFLVSVDSMLTLVGIGASLLLVIATGMTDSNM